MAMSKLEFVTQEELRKIKTFTRTRDDDYDTKHFLEKLFKAKDIEKVLKSENELKKLWCEEQEFEKLWHCEMIRPLAWTIGGQEHPSLQTRMLRVM